MHVEVQLLGRPRARRDGEQVPLRGHKPWILLALLMLTGEPLSRDRLARLLFVDAADPAATLRWNLSQLRRHLGVVLTGDPVALEIPEHVVVDVGLVLHGDAAEAVHVVGLDEELLAGVSASATSELEMWLEDERRRLRRLGIDIRAEAALGCLAQDDVNTALGLARLVVKASPLDENAAVLLVRCLRAAGRATEASAVADRAAVRLRDELGVEPTESLWSAMATPLGGTRRVTGRRAVIARVNAGSSAVAAGATDTGIGVLRSAVNTARDTDQPALLAQTLVALGSALIHGIRGADQEGLALLHEAVPLTGSADGGALAAKACREIGYVDFLRGQYDRALHWFDRARRIAHETETGWVDTYAGTSLDDIGDRRGAAQLFDRALRTAQTTHDQRLEAYTLAVVGRHHLLVDNLEDAEQTLHASLSIVKAIGWTSFRAWPEAVLADVRRRLGDLDGARALSEHALALAEQVGDPCWEAAALRSLGLVTADSGNVDRGVALLRDVPALCRRLPDTYRWVELWGYDALVDVARRYRLSEADAWAKHLHVEASTLGMRPFIERARDPEHPLGADRPDAP